MADNIESRIDLNIDVSNALASIKTLQAQISAFHQSIRNSGNAVNQAVSDNLTKNLLNNINATQKFSASLTTVNDSAQSFTNALEKNKLSLGQYFKFGVASTKNFGKVFTNEFNTIEKVARERVKTLQTQYVSMGRDANGALEAIKVRPLRLDMEQLGTQVAMTAQKQQIFNQLLKQGSTNLLNFGKNTQWAGRQLMVGFTIPLSIMGGMAIKEFEKIEKQAIRFKRVYGDAFSTDAETDAALANMRKLATEFAKYGIEIEKTLELAADAAQMGLKGADLRAQVTEATRLAVLGEVEQQEALRATVAVTNAFGIASEELATKIDFLNAVENETLTAISDLTIAIPKAGPVVQQLGGSVEDLAFFLTAMKEGGINASEGANALKSGLAKLINPTEKASLMLQGFGINLTQIVEQNAGDIKSTVLQFASALDTLDPLNRARAIEELFGRFQFARISTLFDNITREGSQAQRVLELSSASAAQLAILSERELRRVEESPIFKLEKAIERLQEALAPLGAEFIKILTPLIEFGTDVLKNFNNMSDGAKAFVTNITTVLGLIAPIAIMTFGLLANGLANFVKGISFVRSMFGKLAGAGTGLNQMTQYMTQEQLEATASASALGQAHSQLTAVFTSEKVALDGLVRSYNNAILAMGQYKNVAAQTRVRPGTQSTGYAEGVLRVPGPKGAGDIVPAMLSPGEAVIPAKEAQRYRGLISAIISGKIPGFQYGVENLGDTSYRTYTNAVGFQSSAVNQLAGNVPSLAKAPSSAFAGDIAEKGSLYFAPLLVDIVDNALGPNGDVIKELRSNPKYKEFASALADRVQTELNQEFAGVNVAETTVQSKTRQAAVDLAPQYGISAAAVKRTFDTPTTFQDEQTVRVQSGGGVTPANRGPVSRGKRSYTDPSFQRDATEALNILAQTEEEIAVADNIKRGLVKQPGQKRRAVELGHVGLSGRSSIPSIMSAVESAGRQPSAQLKRAVNLASRGKRGVMLGTSPTGEQLPRIEVPMSFTREQIRAAREESRQQAIAPKKDAQSDANVYATTLGNEVEAKSKDPYMYARDRNSPHRLSRQDGESDASSYSEGLKSGTRKANRRSLRRPVADRTTSLGGKLSGIIGKKFDSTVEKGLQDQRQQIVDQEEALQSNVERNQRSRKNIIRDEKENSKAERQLQRQAAAQNRQRLAGRAFGALGTASMVAGMASGMEGPVGEVARGVMPALFGLSAIAPILLALPAPLALLAAGIGAAAFGFIKFNEMVDSARKDGIKMANALSMSTDKLFAFSEATGTVSATEERRSAQEDQLTSATSKQRQFGQEFLGSEFGSEFLESVNTAIASGMDRAPYQIANQLAMAMAQGILTPSQANSIVAALGAELGDYVLSGKISAQLISLVGPNGKDLLEEPLDVLLNVQESGMDNIRAFVDQLPTIRQTIIDAANESVTSVEDEFMDKNFFEKARDVFGAAFAVAGARGQAELDVISKTAEVEAALVQLGLNRIQENQQLVDSLEKQYRIKTDSLEQEIASTTDADQRLQLEKELAGVLQQRKQDLAAINQANTKSFNEIVGMQDMLDQGVFSDALKAAIDARYEGNEAMAVVAKGLLDEINKLEDSEFKTTLQLQLASGDLSPTAAARLLEMKDTTVPLHFNMTASSQGIANASQLLQLLMRGGATDQQVRAEFVLAANVDDPEDFDRRLEAVNQLSQVPTEYGLNVSMTGNNIGIVMDAVEMLDGEPERITYDRILELEEANPGELQGIIDNWDRLTGGADSITKEIIFDFKSVGTGGDALISAYAQATGAGGMIGNLRAMTPEQYAKILSAAVAYFIGGGKNQIKVEEEGNTPQGTGQSSLETFVSGILSSLQKIRNAGINASGGIKELIRALGDGSKEMQTFRGVSQKLLATGYTREFIDAIMSMDEETRSTFISIENGVISVTEAGRALNKAFSEQSLGEYQNSIAQNVLGIGAQIDAMNKLVAAGVSVQDASEMVKDQNLAIAIASQATAKEVRDLADAFEEQAAAQKELALTTPEGRESELQSIISEANSYFSAQESFQNQRYQAAVKAYEDANGIVEAQRDLADNEFELDDLNFALDQIAKQEQDINDEYDKREEAIENIYKANKAIIDQDKEKLDVADALASGDLAAAAKAMRAQTTVNLERNKEAQLDNLQRSRELELAQIRDGQGKSRLELETSIRDLQQEIADIQESKLEPYQRELDLLDRVRQDALRDVQDSGFLGLTQARWAEIANEVDRAKFNVEGYANTLRDRLNAIPGVSVGSDGSISVDAKQIVAPEVSPEPTTTDDTQLAATNPNQSQIDELNRLILITRKRVREGDYDDAAQKQRLMQVNMQRIRDVRSLGGVAAAMGGLIPYMRMGGLLPYKAEGGSIFKSLGTDTVPAMLTPGEFVVRRHAVSNFGVDKLRAINSGTYNGESVYNYSVNVNVKSDANPDEIARSVMGQIKRIDSQRIRGNKF